MTGMAMSERYSKTRRLNPTWRESQDEESQSVELETTTKASIAPDHSNQLSLSLTFLLVLLWHK